MEKHLILLAAIALEVAGTLM